MRFRTKHLRLKAEIKIWDLWLEIAVFIFKDLIFCIVGFDSRFARHICWASLLLMT